MKKTQIKYKKPCRSRDDGGMVVVMWIESKKILKWKKEVKKNIPLYYELIILFKTMIYMLITWHAYSEAMNLIL